MSTDKRLEVLYAHYKDVVASRRTQIRSRYRYLFYIVVVMVLFGLQFLYPTLVDSIFVGLAERFLNTTIEKNYSMFESILLGVFMALVLRYLQISVGVERSYDVTNFLEDRLQSDFGVPIKTEGGAYLKDYPAIMDTYDVLYKIAIPLVFFLIAVAQFLHKIPFNLSVDYVLNVIDVCFSAIIVGFVLLYWGFTYKGSIAKRWSNFRSITGRIPL